MHPAACALIRVGSYSCELMRALTCTRYGLVGRSGVRSLQALAALALDGSRERVALPEAVACSVPTEPSLRVVVLGDASASMQSAINAACIAGAMFSAVFEAEVHNQPHAVAHMLSQMLLSAVLVSQCNLRVT